MGLRNNRIDMLKGLSALMVIWLHVGTFIIYEFTPSSFLMRSLASLCVPLFFIISGYYMGKSKNLSKGTIKLLKTYGLMVVVILVFNKFLGIYDSRPILKNTFILNTSSIGYLWFIRDLIWYRLFYQAASVNNKTKLMFVGIMYGLGLFSLPGLMQESRAGLLYVSLGLILEMSFTNSKISIPSAVVLLVPITTLFKVNSVNYLDFPTMASTLILFMWALGTASEKNYLEFFSSHTIEMLFVHYFIVQLIIKYNLFNNFSFIAVFIIIVALSSLLIFCYDYLKSTCKSLVRAKL